MIGETQLHSRDSCLAGLTTPRTAAALLSLGLLLSVGCDDGRPERVQVSGQVLIDGQPLKSGNLKFVPEGARPSTGRLDDQGRFKLTCYDGNDGVVLGTHRVQVSSYELAGPAKVRWLAPPQYADFRTSRLKYEITEATDDLKIELTWNGGKPFVMK
ncbi:hypothetical protein [Adhaeretor mobilis]|uniref:Carboxypeptidase regulatory-like domain-containing protein n=1 Tax=Adhaeretor mobilis TaxID=1930276 RepID=A0A517MYJ8_9BACT|nr:hypothetical protein [Adhaeretor mobilis]QDS99962.1 hypothetical protein HG15A2_32960 [Adhaeretor mobilis]